MINYLKYCALIRFYGILVRFSSPFTSNGSLILNGRLKNFLPEFSVSLFSWTTLFDMLIFFLRRRPHVATLIFICSGRGIFPCCRNIFLWRRNFGFLVINGFRNLTYIFLVKKIHFHHTPSKWFQYRVIHKERLRKRLYRIFPILFPKFMVLYSWKLVPFLDKSFNISEKD